MLTGRVRDCVVLVVMNAMPGSGERGVSGSGSTRLAGVATPGTASASARTARRAVAHDWEAKRVAPACDSTGTSSAAPTSDGAPVPAGAARTARLSSKGLKVPNTRSHSVEYGL
eukprot:6353688-Prymnesium_polylepis.2